MSSRSSHTPKPGELALFSVADFDDSTELFPGGRATPTRKKPVTPGQKDGDLAAVLRRVWTAQQRFEEGRAQQLGTDQIGLDTLDLLMELGMQPPSVLAVHAGCSNAVMTLSLNRLAARGHVHREPHPIDRRKILIRLAAGTAELVEALTAPRDEALAAAISGLSPREHKIAMAFLGSVADAHQPTVLPESR